MDTISSTEHALTIHAIGFFQTPFKEKFGIPRQASLIKNGTGRIKLYPPYNVPEAVEALEGFSHLWIQFGFHLSPPDKFRPQIRPPRLGGNEKVGVFASRSPFRPNQLGLSLVKLIKVEHSQDGPELVTSCPDLLDGTPIYDIKPYIHYSDSALFPRSGYAKESPQPQLKVTILDEVKQKLINRRDELEESAETILAFMNEVLSYDPRPAYKTKGDEKVYATKFYNFDAKWKVLGDELHVINIDFIPEN